jgi:succinate dehydrogenase / fumarate reductase, cytochrome b subunit
MGSAGVDSYFILRRAHSLLGIVPLGAFLLEHFFSNSTAFSGAAAFNKLVEDLMNIPLIVFIEIFVIGLPLLFHAVLGLIISYTAKNNMLQYKYRRNWAFFLQRLTGVLALVYIVVHVYETRISAALDGRIITFADMQLLLSPTWVKAFYIVGILSIAYHFSNGLATSAITWGITVSRRSQLVMSNLMWGFFVALSVWGISILYAFG